VGDLSQPPGALTPYVTMLNAFVQRRLTPLEFETLYLALFKNDDRLEPGAAFERLDRLFGVVDEYVSEPALRERVGGLGDEDLMAEARDTLATIERLEGTDS